MTTRLINWHVVPSPAGPRLQGELRDHPTKPDGTHALTTPIRGALGRVVTTASGSTYRLGAPLPGWVAMLESVGEPLDEEEPVKRFLPREAR